MHRIWPLNALQTGINPSFRCHFVHFRRDIGFLYGALNLQKKHEIHKMGALFCGFRVFSAHLMLHKESRYRDESAQNGIEMMDLCLFGGH